MYQAPILITMQSSEKKQIGKKLHLHSSSLRIGSLNRISPRLKIYPHIDVLGYRKTGAKPAGRDRLMA
jgi:ethanolamine utilization microcompartment shell protein EutS